jgi:DNA-binding NtrC family response regulator
LRAGQELIQPQHILLDPPATDDEPTEPDDLTQVIVRPKAPADADERQRLIATLDECGGNQTRAAKLLGISRRTLISRIEQWQLPRPKKH